MPNFSEVQLAQALEIAIEAARAAGALLREGYGRAGQVSHKGAIDLVTEFDHRSEAVILERLRRAFPGHAVRAEESGRRPVAGAEYEWLVDPLDGTTNFAHGFPVFAVSLALAWRGELQVGVVYDPLRDELFSASRGRGACVNSQPLRVSEQAELGRALLATGFPYDVRTNPENNFAQFRQFHLRAQGLRRAGAAALDLAWTAAGRLDGYWEYRLKPWDLAGGALCVLEAGGRVTNLAGGEDFLETGSLVASNGRLHPAMLAILRHGDAAPLP